MLRRTHYDLRAERRDDNEEERRQRREEEVREEREEGRGKRIYERERVREERMIQSNRGSGLTTHQEGEARRDGG